MTTGAADPVGKAFAAFAEAMASGRAALLASRPDLDPIDAADGEAYYGMLIEGATQFARADPDRPVFAPWATPHRRWVDNGWDSAYWMAPVAGGRRYRVHGRVGDECYVSFTLYAGSPGHPEKTVRNWNGRELGALGSGDAYAFEVDPPDDACYVISRQYFLDARRQQAGTFSIERLGGDPPSSDVEALARRWRAATSFMGAMTRGAGGGAPGTQLPPYVSVVANRMGDPSQWRESEGGGRGTPDQVYAMGPWSLAADEALELRLRMPRAAYCGVALWNRFSQTVDPRLHRSTINHAEAAREPDGSVRILVAARDPGHPNWLDTGGRRAGSLFFRFLLAEEAPGKIESQVVRLAR